MKKINLLVAGLLFAAYALGGLGGCGASSVVRGLAGKFSASALPKLSFATLTTKSVSLACSDMSVCCYGTKSPTTPMVTALAADCTFDFSLDIGDVCSCGIFTGTAGADGCPQTEVAIFNKLIPVSESPSGTDDDLSVNDPTLGTLKINKQGEIGVPDDLYKALDFDGDGASDFDDPTTDVNGTMLYADTKDNDGDGVPDAEDCDKDGDGTPNGLDTTDGTSGGTQSVAECALASCGGDFQCQVASVDDDDSGDLFKTDNVTCNTTTHCCEIKSCTTSDICKKIVDLAVNVSSGDSMISSVFQGATSCVDSKCQLDCNQVSAAESAATCVSDATAFAASCNSGNICTFK